MVIILSIFAPIKQICNYTMFLYIYLLIYSIYCILQMTQITSFEKNKTFLLPSLMLFFNPKPTSKQCHYCSKYISNKVIYCQAKECHLAYCKKCLTRKFKYSRNAVKSLPSRSWKCPKCKQKCDCKEYLFQTK